MPSQVSFGCGPLVTFTDLPTVPNGAATVTSSCKRKTRRLSLLTNSCLLNVKVEVRDSGGALSKNCFLALFCRYSSANRLSDHCLRCDACTATMASES